MTYNEVLTKKLNDFFGEDTSDWPKSTLRNQLETAVSTQKNMVLTSVEDELLCQSMKLYRAIKDLEDEFMGYYMMELENEKN